MILDTWFSSVIIWFCKIWFLWYPFHSFPSSLLPCGVLFTVAKGLDWVFFILRFLPNRYNTSTCICKLWESRFYTWIGKLSQHFARLKISFKSLNSITAELSYPFCCTEVKVSRSVKKCNLTVNKYIDCRFLLLFCWTCWVFAAIVSSVTCLSSAQGQTAAGLLPILSTGIFNYFQPFAILT